MTSHSETGDFKSDCISALKGHLEALFSVRRDGFRPNATIVGDTLLINRVFSKDIAGFISVTCKDDRILAKFRYAGALSRAKSLGEEAYSAFLETAMKSGSHGELPGYFYVDPSNDVLSFNILLTQCDISKILSEYERITSGGALESGLAWIIGLVLLMESVVSSWLADSLEKLEAGKRVEHFDLLERFVDAVREKVGV